MKIYKGFHTLSERVNVSEYDGMFINPNDFYLDFKVINKKSINPLSGSEIH